MQLRQLLSETSEEAVAQVIPNPYYILYHISPIITLLYIKKPHYDPYYMLYIPTHRLFSPLPHLPTH